MNSYVYYESFEDAISLYEEHEQFILYKSINRYALYDEIPKLDKELMKVFVLIKPQIDANKKRRVDGKKGGRKPKDNEVETIGNEEEIKKLTIGLKNSNHRLQIDETTGFELENHRLENKKPNVNVNVNENVNVNDNEKEIFKEKNIFEFLEDLNWIVNGTPIEINTIHFWEDEKIDRVLLKQAIKETQRRNITNINYVHEVLKNLIKEQTVKTSSPLPEWFDKTIEKKEATQEELKEMEELLKEYR